MRGMSGAFAAQAALVSRRMIYSFLPTIPSARRTLPASPGQFTPSQRCLHSGLDSRRQPWEMRAPASTQSSSSPARKLRRTATLYFATCPPHGLRLAQLALRGGQIPETSSAVCRGLRHRKVDQGVQAGASVAHGRRGKSCTEGQHRGDCVDRPWLARGV